MLTFSYRNSKLTVRQLLQALKRTQHILFIRIENIEKLNKNNKIDGLVSDVQIGYTSMILKNK